MPSFPRVNQYTNAQRAPPLSATAPAPSLLPPPLCSNLTGPAAAFARFRSADRSASKESMTAQTRQVHKLSSSNLPPPLVSSGSQGSIPKTGSRGALTQDSENRGQLRNSPSKKSVQAFRQTAHGKASNSPKIRPHSMSMACSPLAQRSLNTAAPFQQRASSREKLNASPVLAQDKPRSNSRLLPAPPGMGASQQSNVRALWADTTEARSTQPPQPPRVPHYPAPATGGPAFAQRSQPRQRANITTATTSNSAAAAAASSSSNTFIPGSAFCCSSTSSTSSRPTSSATSASSTSSLSQADTSSTQHPWLKQQKQSSDKMAPPSWADFQRTAVPVTSDQQAAVRRLTGVATLRDSPLRGSPRGRTRMSLSARHFLPPGLTKVSELRPAIEAYRKAGARAADVLEEPLRAAAALGVKNKPLLPLLAEVYSAGPFQSRAACLLAMQAAGWQVLTHYLLSCLDASKAEEQRQCASSILSDLAMEQVSEPDSECIALLEQAEPKLVAAMTDSSDFVTTNIMSVLSCLSKSVTAQLNMSVSREASASTGSLSMSNSLRSTLDLLNSKFDSEREQALSMLMFKGSSLSGTPEILEKLTHILARDKSAVCRALACRTLTEMQAVLPQVVEAMWEVVNTDKDPQVRSLAERSLKHLKVDMHQSEEKKNSSSVTKNLAGRMKGATPRRAARSGSTHLNEVEQLAIQAIESWQNDRRGPTHDEIMSFIQANGPALVQQRAESTLRIVLSRLASKGNIKKQPATYSL